MFQIMKKVGNSVRAVLPLVALALVFGLGTAAFAQEGGDAGVTITDIVSPSEFTTMITNIATSAGTVVKAAIGLSVGLFIVGFLLRLVKRYTRAGA